jgi:sugar-phosphatase
MDRQTRLKAILFDFDETLVTLAVDWPRARAQLRELFAPSGFDSPFRPMTESLRAAREFCEAVGHDELFLEALGFLREVEGRGLDGAIAMPGAKELLDAVVAKGIPFAIVSNNDTRVIRAAVERFCFPAPSVVVGRDSVRHMKPDPEGARLAMAELGLLAADICLVGNSAYDLALGQALGIQTYLVGPQMTPDGSATYLQSLTELMPLLKETGRWA